MRRLVIALCIFVALIAKAQTNLQVLYDFGKDRNYLTTTVEMFKADKWGTNYLFVDMYFNGGTQHYPSTAYTEIARTLKFWNGPLSAHVEYYGGLFGVCSSYLPINNAWLAGVDYGWHDTSFTKFLNFKVLYKYIQGKNPASFQLTGVWNLNYFNKKLTVSGFADFWREDNVNFTNANGDVIIPSTTDFVFITEPQFWYNATEHLSLGGEVQVASNFSAVNGLKVAPKVGIKWNF